MRPRSVRYWRTRTASGMSSNTKVKTKEHLATIPDDEVKKVQVHEGNQ